MLELLSYQFGWNALITGGLLAICCGILGIYLNLRRLSLIGDGIAHAAFGGVALGFLIGVPPIYTALITAIIGSLGVQKLIERTKIYGDAAIAVILAVGMGLAITILGYAKAFNANLFSYIFGSILTVSTEEIYLLAGLTALIIGFVVFKYKELLISTFNPDLAQVQRINTKFIHTTLMVLTAGTIVIAMRAVGILLVGGLLVIPALIALKRSKSFMQSVFISIAIAGAAVLFGTLLSFEWNLPPSGIIILMLGVFFLVSNFKKS